MRRSLADPARPCRAAGRCRGVCQLRRPVPCVTMCAVSRFRRACLALVAVALALTAAPVEAHRGPLAPPASTARLIDDTPPGSQAASSVGAAPAESRLAWVAGPARGTALWPVLVIALVAGLAVASRRPRAALALGLVLLVAVLAFESGVHSVHHLGEVGRGSACAVASTSQQLSGMEVDAVRLERAPGDPGIALSAPAAPAPRALEESPHEGRAPPRHV